MSSKRRHSDGKSINERSSCDIYYYKRKTSRKTNQRRPEYRLHVGNLAEGVKKRHLEHIFKRFGKLKEIWMSSSRPSYAFVVFLEETNAILALEANNTMPLYGQRICVTHAKPRNYGKRRPEYNPRLRCYGCGALGHVFRYCPEEFAQKTRKYSHKRYYHQYSRRFRDYDRCRRSYERQRTSRTKW